MLPHDGLHLRNRNQFHNCCNWYNKHTIRFSQYILSNEEEQIALFSFKTHFILDFMKADISSTLYHENIMTRANVSDVLTCIGQPVVFLFG